MESNGEPDNMESEINFEQLISLARSNCFSSDGKMIPIDDIEKLTFEQVISRAQRTCPKTLYRYKPNTVDRESGHNYSQDELEKGRIYLSTPEAFNDPFDSRPAYDSNTWNENLICHYLRFLNQSIVPKNSEEAASIITKVFLENETSAKTIDLSHLKLDSQELPAFKLITEKLLSEWLTKHKVTCAALEECISSTLESEINRCIGSLRIACLSGAGINSSYMWAHYANDFKGFCIAYRVNDSSTQPSSSHTSWPAKSYLLPVCYGLQRHDMTETLANMATGHYSERQLSMQFSCSVLSKGIEWFQEREWRIVVPQGDSVIGNDKCTAAPKIDHVVAGPRMTDEEYGRLKKICCERDIQLVRTKISNNTFEVKEIE